MIIAGLASVVAGLIIGFRELFLLLAARRTGVIVRKGFHNLRITRDAEPERFERLVSNRGKTAAAGFGLSVAGLAVASGGAAPVIGLAVFVFAGYCLVRGLTTGRMFAFWSLTLFGEATRRGNPVWFWTYTAMNAAIVLIGALGVLGAMGV